MNYIPDVQPGEGPNHPLNKDWINKLVYVANNVINLKIRINDRDYPIQLSDDGSVIDLGATFPTGSNTYIQSGSFTGSFTGGSDVWQ